MKFQVIKEKTLAKSVTKEIPIAYVGSFDGYSEGTIELTSEMFEEAVTNFNKEPLKLPLYKGHADCQMSLTGEEAPSMGWILGLRHDEEYLYAMVEFTEEMQELIEDGKFKYCSIYMKNDIDRESGEEIGARLYSLAITNQPFLDKLPEIRLSKNSISNNIYFSKGLEMKKLKLTKDDVSKETLPEAKEAEMVMENLQEAKTEDSNFDPVAALEELRNAMDPEMSLEDFVKYVAELVKAPKEEETEEVAEMASTEEVAEEETDEALKEEEEEMPKAEMTLSKTVKGLNVALSKANAEIALLKKKVTDHENEVIFSIVNDAVLKGKLLDAEKHVFIELGKSNKKLFDEMLKVRNIKPSVVLNRISTVETKDSVKTLSNQMNSKDKALLDAFKKLK